METLAGRYAAVDDIKKLQYARKSCLHYPWDTVGESVLLRLCASYFMPG